MELNNSLDLLATAANGASQQQVPNHTSISRITIVSPTVEVGTNNGTDNNNLDERVEGDIDYTYRDEIHGKLSQLITCPILREIPSENSIIFNEQCYDLESFDGYAAARDYQNKNHPCRGYNPETAVLICPHTGANINFLMAMTMRYERVEYEFMQNILINKIEGITEENIGGEYY